MKKIFLIMSILILGMSIIGCKSSRLTKKTKEYIIETYVKRYNEKKTNEVLYIDSEDVEIDGYFGKYGMSYVTVINIDRDWYRTADDPEYVIENLIFNIYGSYHILVFYEDNYYYLDKAYELSIVTYEDLKKIQELVEEFNREENPKYN